MAGHGGPTSGFAGHDHCVIDCWAGHRQDRARRDWFGGLVVAVVDATLLNDLVLSHLEDDSAALTGPPVLKRQHSPALPPQEGMVVPLGTAVPTAW